MSMTGSVYRSESVKLYENQSSPTAAELETRKKKQSSSQKNLRTNSMEKAKSSSKERSDDRDSD